MTDLPEEDTDRLDVVEALEAAGWAGDADNPLGLLRKNGATFAVVGHASLTGPGGWTAEFPINTPAVVIVAACLAAALTPETRPAGLLLSLVPSLTP